jgi:hypothetical protein
MGIGVLALKRSALASFIRFLMLSACVVVMMFCGVVISLSFMCRMGVAC